MTLPEAMAEHGPPWLGLWINILLIGIFILPLGLLVWRSTRIVTIVCLALGALGGFGVYWLYGQLGYVRLLGLGHIVFWTPLAVYLWRWVRSDEIGKVQRALISASLATVLISLAFDYVDTARYILGERTPLAHAAPAE